MLGTFENILFDHADYIGAYPTASYSQHLDGIWILPHHAYQKHYLETITKLPVTIIPYLYSPYFLEQHATSIASNSNAPSPYYDPKRKKNIAICEPNLNLVKHSIIPIAIIEQLYHHKPQVLATSRASIYCSDTVHNCSNSFAHRKAFKYFAKQLTCARILSTENRYPLPLIFSHDCNILLSHQHLCALNYIYLDAMYFNIPVVHNSDMLKTYGYYYPGFDTHQGACALERAHTQHDQQLNAYQEQTKELLLRFSPTAAENVQAFHRIIQSLLQKANKKAAHCVEHT